MNTDPNPRTPPSGSPRRPRPGRRAAVAACALLASICLLASGARSDDETSDLVGDARTALEKWVETRRLIAKEKRDWALGREILGDRIEIVRNEIESLRTRIADAEASVSETDEKTAELQQENERLKQAGAVLSDQVARLEERTKALLARLPELLQDRVRPVSQRFPADPSDTKLSLSERFLSVIGVLNEANKFNNEITLSMEVRSLPDGSTAEVKTMYVGVSYAFYVSADGRTAGVGSSGADSWIWTPDNAAAPQIAQAIEILEGEGVAAFVPLPVEIR